jgi:hypothetical protein
MLSVTFYLLYPERHYALCRFAECHYAECRYAECRGALVSRKADQVNLGNGK